MPRSRHSLPRLAPVLLLLCCCVALVALIDAFGHRQFGAFDHSIATNTAWYLQSGLRPYHDYYLTVPVGFYAGAGAAFAAWGPRWSALVWVAAAYAVATFLAHAWLLRRLVGGRLAVALAFACQCLTMVVTGYWWFNPITAVAGALYLTAAFALLDAPEERAAHFAYGACALLLLAMKPNVAGLLIALVTLALCLHRPCVRPALGLLAGAVAALAGALWLAGIDPADVLASYRAIGAARGRPTPALFLLREARDEVFVVVPLLVLCALPLLLAGTAAGARRAPRDPALLWATGLPLVVLAVAGLWRLQVEPAAMALLIAATLAPLAIACRPGPWLLGWGLACAFYAWTVTAGETHVLTFLALLLLLPGLSLVTAWRDAGGAPGRDRAAAGLGLAGLAATVLAAVTDADLRLVALPMALLGPPLAVLVRREPGAAGGAPAAAAYLGALLALAVGVPEQQSWQSQAPALLRGEVLVGPLDDVWALCLMLAAAGVLAALLSHRRPPPAWLPTAGTWLARWAPAPRAAAGWLAVICVAVSLLAGAQRWRVRAVGEFYEDGPLAEPPGPPFFRRFLVGPRARAVIHQLEAALRTRRSPGEVFFGPRLEFAYAAFGLPPPAGQPLWWHPGSSYPAAAAAEVEERFRQHRFALCVFLWDPRADRGVDWPFLPRGIARYVRHNYAAVPNQDIVVFERLSGD